MAFKTRNFRVAGRTLQFRTQGDNQSKTRALARAADIRRTGRAYARVVKNRYGGYDVYVRNR